MKIFFSICILFHLLACNHSVTSPTVTSDTVKNTSYIKYKVDGAEVQFTGTLSNLNATGEGVVAEKSFISDYGLGTSYLLKGQNGKENSISFNIVTDSLVPRSFLAKNIINIPSKDFAGSLVIINTVNYSNYQNRDTLRLNITRHSAGSVDGNFAGTLSRIERIQGDAIFYPITITEGVFKNVKVLY